MELKYIYLFHIVLLIFLSISFMGKHKGENIPPIIFQTLAVIAALALIFYHGPKFLEGLFESSKRGPRYWVYTIHSLIILPSLIWIGFGDVSSINWEILSYITGVAAAYHGYKFIYGN